MDYPNLTFEKADTDTFRNLSMAYKAMNKGGNMACVLNAANEVVVDAFLRDKIGFLEMSDILESCMEKSTFVSNPTYDDFVSSDEESRVLANALIR
jgi:1-deoxy-D-xylulose-5-phosphate reductoisomerase